MSLADVLERTADLLTSTLVPGTLKKVYPLPPQSSPQASVLPAAYPRAASGETNYSVSQRVITHTLEIVAMVARADAVSKLLPDAWTKATVLLEPMMAAFEGSMSLGAQQYFDARVVQYEIGPASYLDAQYMTLILTVSIKEKLAVTMSA